MTTEIITNIVVTKPVKHDLEANSVRFRGASKLKPSVSPLIKGVSPTKANLEKLMGDDAGNKIVEDLVYPHD